MSTRRFAWLIAATLAAGVPAASIAASRPAPAPAPDSARFGHPVDHPFFPLVPGTTRRYSERAGRQRSDIEVTVTPEARRVLGIECTVVRERVRERDALTQETLLGYAQDDSGSVWILFEDAREYRGTRLTSTEGSWQAGVDGARAGVVMPARAQPGEPFAQGFRKGLVEDRARIVSASDSVSVPHGRFGGCLRLEEWSMLEAGTDRQWYARGVGLVRAESAAHEVTELVSVTPP